MSDLVMKYFVDANGTYLGGWDADPPVGAIEVASAPDDARQVWDGAAWGDAPIDLPDLAPYQFRAMLKLSGKQDDLYAFIEALPDPDRTIAQSKLEYSLVFQRNNDVVLAAEQALGFTKEELDALWLQASQIL